MQSKLLGGYAAVRINNQEELNKEAKYTANRKKY